MHCSLTTLLATVAAVLAFLPCSIYGNWRVRQKLLNEVFRGYNRLVPPQDNITQPVTVGIELRVLKLLKLDQEEQSVSIIGWIQLTWRDPRLSWDDGKFEGVDHLVVPTKKIWTPDITLQRSDDVMKQLSDVNARLVSSGALRLTLPYILKTPCKTEPEDREAKCYIKLGSWADDTSLLDVEEPVLTPVNQSNHRWHYSLVEAYRDQREYGSPPHNVFSYIVFEIHMSKKEGVDEPEEEENAGNVPAANYLILLTALLVGYLRTVS